MSAKIIVRAQSHTKLFADLNYGDWFKFHNRQTGEVFIRIRNLGGPYTAVRIEAETAEAITVAPEAEVMVVIPTIDIEIPNPL